MFIFCKVTYIVFFLKLELSSIHKVGENMEISMDPLYNLQQDLQLSIRKAKLNFDKTPKERLTEAYVVTRLEYLEDQWRSFTDTHRTIVTDVDPAQYRSSSYYISEMYDATLELYCSFKTDLKECLGNFLDPTKLSQPNHCIAASSQVKLPKIQIPIFSGKYVEWPSFKDIFVSLIHNNPNLGNVQKLHYLKAHCAGEAEQLLRHVSVTDDNYSEAWALLNKRFSNQKYLSNCILKRLVNQKAITTDSPEALKGLLDTTLDCLNGLKNQGIAIDSWDTIVIFIISDKLDSESRKLWESQISKTDNYPTIQEFQDFLEQRFRSLEFLSSCPAKPTSVPQYNVKVHHAATVVCPFCFESHRLYNCKSFSGQNINERRSFATKNSLCYNCLVPGHSVFMCRQSSRCRVCNKKHHSLLHISDPSKLADKPSNAKSTFSFSNSNFTAFHSATKSQVILPTAVLKVKSQTGNDLKYRSLLDQGSQVSFISETAVQSLGLTKIPTKTEISGIGNSRNDTTLSKSMVRFNIQSTYDPHTIITVQAHVLEKNTSFIPPPRVQDQICSNFSKLKLADPYFHSHSEIDMLLGADVCSQILVDGLLKNPSGTLIAQNTVMGWVVSGQVI